MKHYVHHRHTLACIFGCVAAALTLAHPWLHAFEGGSLDMILMYMTAFTSSDR